MAQHNGNNGLYYTLNLHGSVNKSDGWHPSAHYETSTIEAIKDPSSKSMREITSIPSPFARIHLFETAFSLVAAQSRDQSGAVPLNGTSMHHKLVSDALDVAEIFYSLEVFQANPNYNLETIAWEIDAEIQTLKASTHAGQRLYGETLELYKKQDGDSSNLNSAHTLYVLKCNHRVVGGTSPSTLFFAAYNEDNALGSLGLGSGNDVFFDTILCPLYERSIGFKRYLFGLFKVHPSLQASMKPFYSYLEATLKHMESNGNLRGEWDELNNLWHDSSYTEASFAAEFAAATVLHGGTFANGEFMEVLRPAEGTIYHYRRKKDAIDMTKSDFLIASTRYQGAKKPLVLTNGFSMPLKYVGTSVWDKNTVVPYDDPAPLDQRYLPGQLEQYPYLTVSDFLEPYLIELPYSVDKANFFDGNPDGFVVGDKHNQVPPDNSYLLPIKKEFFGYFSIGELCETPTRGKPSFKLRKISRDMIWAELRIPVQKSGQEMVFERIYSRTTTTAIADPNSKEGVIVKGKFTVGMLPKNNSAADVLQYVMLVVDESNANGQTAYNYTLRFLKENDPAAVPFESAERTSKKRHAAAPADTTHYKIKAPFDIIEVSNGIGKGLIVPRPTTPRGGTESYIFAIDFGTTNTHIEYSKNNEEPKPFDIEKEDAQIVTLFDPDWGVSSAPNLPDLVVREWSPTFIGRTSEYHFPIRTVVAESKYLDHQTIDADLLYLNIPFYYEKKSVLGSTDVFSNLKWEDGSSSKGDNAVIAAENRTKGFLAHLLILVRNKVLLKGGDLARTKLICFYPSSMPSNRRKQLARTWDTLVKGILHPSVSVISFSESEVPFYMYSSATVKSAMYPVVNIDIGGGTTDIVVFENNNSDAVVPKFQTSFRFAGNAVFGEGYDSPTAKGNGIYLAYAEPVNSYLSANAATLRELGEVYKQLQNSPNASSADLISFFFSLERAKVSPSFSMTQKLESDDSFKIVFLVFFGAIIYHVARLMKAQGMKMPRHICFGGNGSRILGLLDLSPDKRDAAKLAKLIFEKVYEVAYHEDGLGIVQTANPKEATSKGGIKKYQKTGEQQNDYDSLVLLGDKDVTVLNSDAVNFPQKKLQYSQLDETFRASVREEVEGFLDMLFGLNNFFSFKQKLGIKLDPAQYKAELLRDITSNLAEGIAQRRQSDTQGGSSDSDISESLFFYPLIAGLHQLTIAIHNGTLKPV